MNLPELDFEFLRQQIIGIDTEFDTPFGSRPLVYCDYTASGRCLRFIEEYLLQLQRNYANTHTEDDVTGRSMTLLLHEAEASIKAAVNAGPQGRIVACGTGATGAIDKLQQILGVALPPATRRLLLGLVQSAVPSADAAALERFLQEHQPVVFVGPYEHHSNEVTWRQGLASVVEVDLDAEGGVDLEHLEVLLGDARYEGRLKIGSFSSASNVTGMRTPVHEIARLLHRHHALACFDYAASAPYVHIDMSPPRDPDGGDPSLDAVFVSPHKFLGGPGSTGVLVFKESLYRSELPPTVGGGGTVDYVGLHDQDFIVDIEQREKAGTPGVLQTLKAALAFQVKAAVGEARIEAREHELIARAMKIWSANPSIEFVGNPDPGRRIAIISFNLRHPRGDYLHPKFVTTLANDLFGLQSRAGCSCAGPYGHRLLGIDDATSQRYRQVVHEGLQGIKPGWCRVGFHYTMDEADVEYIIETIDFLAREGHRFLPLYRFDVMTGAWTHRDEVPREGSFSLENALRASHVGPTARPVAERRAGYREYLDVARDLAARLAASGDPAYHRLEGEAGELQHFALPRECARPLDPV